MDWRSAWRRRARTLRALGPAGWLGLAEAWLTLAWVDAVISWLPYTIWRGWLRPAASETSPASPRDVERLVGLVAIGASHYPRPVSCLRRTVVLRHVLARRGLSAACRFGVRREGQALIAHAWLERGGLVLNDSQDVAVRYAPLEAP
jgi:hypothetical protein